MEGSKNGWESGLGEKGGEIFFLFLKGWWHISGVRWKRLDFFFFCKGMMIIYYVDNYEDCDVVGLLCYWSVG